MPWLRNSNTRKPDKTHEQRGECVRSPHLLSFLDWPYAAGTRAARRSDAGQVNDLVALTPSNRKRDKTSLKKCKAQGRKLKESKSLHGINVCIRPEFVP